MYLYDQIKSADFAINHFHPTLLFVALLGKNLLIFLVTLIRAQERK